MIKKTLHWVRTEWGIVSARDEMSVADAARWLRQWVPFGVRTIGYGTLSVALGPLTADHRASTWAMKRWSRQSLKKLNITTRTSGAHLVPEGAVMFAANHQSLLDILVLGAVLPGDIKWAAKRSVMNIPFLGWHLTLAGHVPVDRDGGRKQAVQTIHHFKRVLEDNKALLIFPEGTRSEDGRLRAFKHGGFYAAVRAGAPVVPVALEGTHSLMHKGANDSGGTRAARVVDVRLGEPLYATAAGSERRRVVELCERAHAAVSSMHQAMVTRRDSEDSAPR